MSAINKWNERYATNAANEHAPLPLIFEACRGVAPGIALDLACGTGRHAKALAGLGWRVVALDGSVAAISNLRLATLEHHFDIDSRVQDLEDPAFRIEPDSYDLVCDCFYLDRRLFAQIRSAIRRGGTFFGALPMVDVDPCVAPMNPAYLVNPGELITAFADWRVLHYSETRASACKRMVAQIIARRPAAEGHAINCHE